MADVRSKPMRVLVVDDLPDAADSLSLLLAVWGYDTHVAYGGSTALELARTLAPDCIISDIGMPGLDGYALAAAVRADPALARVKLVALSSYSDDQHVRRVAAAGFDYRLTKPATPDEIRELLHMMENIQRLAEKTEELARKNVELAAETKDLIQGVKEDLKEVKQEVKELKDEVKSMKPDQPDYR